MDESLKPNRWVCPNDRELTLRAKLRTGWSVKSHNFQTETRFGRPAPEEPNAITEQEQKMIVEVLNRSQQVEQMERNRINKLIERLKNMKRNANGDGEKCCAICNEMFRFFSNQYKTCSDCSKLICAKCGVDSLNQENKSIYLCRICSETRETWKKSGAWFLNSLPSYCYNLVSALQKNNSFDNDSLKDKDEETFQLSRLKGTPKSRMHLDALPHISDHLCHEIITTPILTVDHLPNGFFTDPRPSISVSSNNGTNHQYVTSSPSSFDFNYSDNKRSPQYSMSGESPELLSSQSPLRNTNANNETAESSLKEKYLVVNENQSRNHLNYNDTNTSEDNHQSSPIVLRRTGSRSNSPNYFRHGIRSPNPK